MTKQLYLVNPPNPDNMKGFPGAPLALDYWIRTHCKDVESIILDESETAHEDLDRSLSSKISSSDNPQYVGITATTATYFDAIKTAEAVRRIRPNARIILGGHHCNGQEDIILGHHQEINYVVTGEGERALEAILNGNIRQPGVHSRMQPTVIGQKNQGIRLEDQDLDEMTVDKFNLAYQRKALQFDEVNLVTARGCPKACSFCSVANERVRKQSVESVVNQFDFLYRQMQESGEIKPIAVQDNFFAQDNSRAKRIATGLMKYIRETGNQFNWNMQTRVEQFAEDEELVDLLSRAGCTSAYFGIENFDPRILHFINKFGTKNTEHQYSQERLNERARRYIENSRTAISNCLRYGINPHIDFQVGFQVEDLETERINLKAFRDIGRSAVGYGKIPMVFPSLSVVYPGTEFYLSMINSGVGRDIYEEFTTWERKNKIKYRKKIGGLFAHGNGGIPLGILNQEVLRNGKYKHRVSIDQSKLDRVKSYISRLRQIPGIFVHDFNNPEREVK